MPKSAVRRCLAVIIMSIMVALSAGEVGARLMFAVKDALKAWALRSPAVAVTHDSLTIADPRGPGLWTLRPGLTQTLRQLVTSMTSPASADYYRNWGQRLGIHDDDIVYRINSEGFKGPQIDQDHGRFRIVVIGDSVTFGSFFDAVSPPRVMERALREAGLNVEVINAGVPGYQPKHVLMRIEDFTRLRPDLTIVFLGWNAIYNDQFVTGAAKYFAMLRLAKTAYRYWNLRHRPELFIYGTYNRATELDPYPSALRDANSYRATWIADVERIVVTMQQAGGRVALATLPGLFRDAIAPSAAAIDIGHLPPYTHNPYVFARITARTNALLREAASKRRIGVIDLERWAASLPDHDGAFTDAVHFHVAAQGALGREMANRVHEFLGRKATFELRDRPARQRRRKLEACPKWVVADRCVLSC